MMGWLVHGLVHGVLVRGLVHGGLVYDGLVYELGLGLVHELVNRLVHGRQ